MSYQTLYSMPCRLACNRYTSVDSVFEAQGDSNDIFLPPLPTSQPMQKFPQQKSCNNNTVKENMEYDPSGVNTTEGFQMDKPSACDIICKRCLRRHDYRLANSCNYNQSYSWDNQMLYKNNPPVNYTTPIPRESYENIPIYSNPPQQPVYVPSQMPQQMPSQMPPRMAEAPSQMPQQPVYVPTQMPQQLTPESCGCDLSDMDYPYVQESQPDKYNYSSTWLNQSEFRKTNNNFY